MSDKIKQGLEDAIKEREGILSHPKTYRYSHSSGKIQNMKANELRIGNWVMNFDKPHKIRDGEDIGDAEIHNCFQSIPLTPEILEKAGGYFIHNHKGSLYAFDNSGIDVCFKKSGGVYFVRFNTLKIIVRNNILINNLHQLQNLYFALTGEEFEINL